MGSFILGAIPLALVFLAIKLYTDRHSLGETLAYRTQQRDEALELISRLMEIAEDNPESFPSVEPDDNGVQNEFCEWHTHAYMFLQDNGPKFP